MSDYKKGLKDGKLLEADKWRKLNNALKKENKKLKGESNVLNPSKDGMVYHSDGGGYLKYDPNAAETIMTIGGLMTYCPHSGGFWFYR